MKSYNGIIVVGIGLEPTKGEKIVTQNSKVGTSQYINLTLPMEICPHPPTNPFYKPFPLDGPWQGKGFMQWVLWGGCDKYDGPWQRKGP